MNTIPLALHREFSPETLRIDCAAEVARITEALRDQVRTKMRRRGLVLGLSGGIDSSVCAALAVHALGARNVYALYMPENDSDPDSLALGRELAETYSIDSTVEDIGPTLAAMGCYRRRDDIIRQIEPAYGEGWACKVAITSPLNGEGYAISTLVLQAPDGTQTRHRMPASAYLGIVAATNMKQRTRKQMEYYHADRLNYAVLGTPNRLEYDQGFFVKNGDGAADVKPIAHLYKSQVYQLAEYLGVPEKIRRRPPTTDTWSLAQTQEEFYFALPYDRMDLCLYALNNGIDADETAKATGLTPAQVEWVWQDIHSKRKTTRPLHLAPLLVEAVF
ncbi:NAD(+) synthase [Rhizobium sp. BK376]|uniref:NAD(+) synthase n=1 Tax=Rhizobium sp. BK376 TaxID=2512149 RepID=UPI00105390BF|nr:NAD(+) synthase [Rhizobium sp. BK376]TCR73237.1 NAD+ synthase [Rhizobium sp. BK376]